MIGTKYYILHRWSHHTPWLSASLPKKPAGDESLMESEAESSEGTAEEEKRRRFLPHRTKKKRVGISGKKMGIFSQWFLEKHYKTYGSLCRSAQVVQA